MLTVRRPDIADPDALRNTLRGNVEGGRSVPWCWDHEREVARCRRDGHFCAGEPVTVSDPTGEAAILFVHAATE